MRKLYFGLAVLGTVIPYFFFIQYFSTEGVNLPGFVSALFANGAAAGFSSDLLITSVVFWIAMFYQRRKADGPQPFVFIVLNLVIGLSCALPAYLYARENSPGTTAG